MVFWEGVLVVLVLVLVPLVLVHTADEPDAVVPAHYFRAPPKKGWGMSPEDRTALEEQLRALPLEQSQERLRELELTGGGKTVSARTRRLADFYAAHPRRTVEAEAPKMAPETYEAILHILRTIPWSYIRPRDRNP
jgi:hypothetical protein